MNVRDRDFVDAAEVVDRSVAVRSASICVGAIETAVRESRIRRALAGVRVTPAGWWLAAAAGCTTHVALRQFMPPRVAPATPLTYWMVVAFAALAAAAGFITVRSASTAAAVRSAGTANARKS
jgi:hypothetical protein